MSPKGKVDSSMFNTPIFRLDMKLAQQLKKLIHQHGTTVSILSKSVKTPNQTIHNWLSGSKPRDLDQVKKVADHFKVSLDFLLYGIESEKPTTPIEAFRDEINAGIFEVVLRRVKK